MASLGLALTNKHYTWGAPHASIFHQSTTTIINEQKQFITGWWFGSLFIFSNSWDDDPIWHIYISTKVICYHVSMNSPSFINDILPWFIVCIICCWLNTPTSPYIWTHYDDFTSQRHWNYEPQNFCNINSPKLFETSPVWSKKQQTSYTVLYPQSLPFGPPAFSLAGPLAMERERERSPITGSHMSYSQNFPNWK